MRTFLWWILGCLSASPAAYSLSSNVVATQNVKARLVSESGAIGPGQSIWVALDLDIRDGWHTYWRNPGDSGQATTLAWTLPAGFTAGDILWTTPHRFELPPLVNYGYAKQAVHLVQITAPKELKPGVPVELQAKAAWLVCSDVCIPEDARLQLQLPTTAIAAVADPKESALFAAARSELPNPAPAPTSARVVRVDITTGRRELVRELQTVGPTGSGGLTAVLVSADGRTIVYGSQRYFSDLLLIEGLR